MLAPFLLSSFFPQERGSVPSWFVGSSWFRLGFGCLPPFFSLFSFFRKGVLFHHDLLVPLGSGWGSGACLPSSLFFGSGACLASSLFFLSSGNGFCSIMICWLLLVPSGFPVLVLLLLSSFFPQERGSVPSWFAGSSWFRLGFGCLSPFFSLLSFLRKGVLFHHDLLVLPGSGWGSGACLPSSLFFGSGACLPSSLFFLSSGRGFCSIMICWFLLVPAGDHDLLVLPGSSWGSGACLPYSLFFGSGACLPSSLFFLSSGKGFCSIMISGSSWFRLGFRCLSCFFSLLSFLRKGVLFHHDLLVPPGSGWGSGACLPSSLFFLSSGNGFCSIMVCWFLLVSAGVPVPSSLFFGSGACLASSLFFLSSGKGCCSIMICFVVEVTEGVKQKTGVCQTVPSVLHCT